MSRLNLNNLTSDYNVATLHKIFNQIQQQVNGISENKISAKTNSGTAAPTTGTFAQGDFIPNSAPSEAGTAGSKYVITGWICSVAGTPGTWLACRSLTGN